MSTAPSTPATAAITLSQFYSAYYAPLFMPATRNRELYSNALRHWRRITGDPLLAKLDGQEGQHVLLQFRAAMSEATVVKRDNRTLAPETINSVLRCINRLFRIAGRRGPNNADGLGLLAEPPRVRQLGTVRRLVRVLSVAELNALYQAAEAAYMPRLDEVTAADWWRAFFVVAYQTALRAQALLCMEVEHIDWKERTLFVPPDKTKVERVKPLRRETLSHLRKVIGPHNVVFPWPHVHCGRSGRGSPRFSPTKLLDSPDICWTLGEHRCFATIKKAFYRQLRLIFARAGIASGKHKPVHVFRKTAATVLAQSQVSAVLTAGRVLDHTQYRTTMQHYIADLELQRTAVEAMPWPSAFAAGVPVASAAAAAKPKTAQDLIDERLSASIDRLAKQLANGRHAPKANGHHGEGKGVVSRLRDWIGGLVRRSTVAEIVDDRASVTPEDLERLQALVIVAGDDAPDVTEGMSEFERVVYSAVGNDDTQAEGIARATCPPGADLLSHIGAVMGCLTLLMLRKAVERRPGNCYRRAPIGLAKGGAL